jgi:hypothetical protein
MDSQHDLRHFHLLIPSTVVVWILHSIVIGFWELWFGFFTLSWSDSENFWNQGGAHWTNRMWICFICFIYLCSIGHCHGQVVVCWGPSMWSGVTAGPRIQDGASWCPCANASPVFHDPFILFSPSDSFIKLSWNWHERRENLWSLGNARNRGSEAQRRLSQSRGVQDSSVRRVVIRRKDWARFQPTGDGRESYSQREKKGERSGERWPKIGGECRVARAPRPCRADGLRIRPHRLLPVKFKFSGRRTQMFQILRVSPVCPTKYCSAFLFFLLAPDEDGYTGYLAVVKLVQLGYSDSEEAQKLFLKK